MYGQQPMMPNSGPSGPNMGGMAGMSGMGGNGLLDPSTNNQPLQFNANKGKPLIMSMPMGKDMDLDRQDTDDMANMSQSPEINSPSNMSGPMGSGPSMGPMGPMSWGGMMGPNMMGMDPNMMMNPQMAYAQQQYGYMGGPGPMMDSGPIQKEVITLKSCVLYPPPPNAPPPTTRERPPGCRTVFVGGLPETITVDILTEIFENFGVICSKRMSKKNFAHIRYEQEESVERALYLSAYRVKIEDKDDKANTGRIHVDYAQARDDLYEWECKQRTFAREERHRMRMEEARLRPPSPPPVVHYTDHEASQLTEALKGDESFGEASQVLITWLDRGDCNRRNSSHFYTMIQTVNAHIRRLLGERQTHDEELENIKIQFRLRLEGIIKQFEQIERIFAAVSKQKAWDHFTKAQRKNIDVWRKQANETIKSQRDEFFKERQEAEMEMSDGEEQETAPKKKKYMDPAEYAHAAMLEWQTTQLKDENEALKCQLEAYKNEVEIVKHETKTSDDGKDRQVKALQNALQGMQQQLIKAKQQLKDNQDEISTLKKSATASRSPAPLVVPVTVTSDDSEVTTEQVSVVVVDKDTEDEAADSKATVAMSSGEQTTEGVADSSGLGPHSSLPEKEARTLALLSTFLHVHPFGASIDYIWSYLQRLDLKIRTGELEDLMERYPALYKQDIHGVGASIEKRWKFIGFDPEQRNMILL